MSRLLEHDVKLLLSRAGIRVPRGEVVSSPAAAAATCSRMSAGAVIKALVPANRRAKSGLVAFVDASSAEARAAELLARTFEEARVERLLVEELITTERELFFSLVLDRTRRRVVALASLAGGVEIEETAAGDPRLLATIALDPLRHTMPHEFRSLWAGLGLTGPALPATVAACMLAARVFFENEATILELNPLALVAGSDGRGPEVVALGAVMAIDDNALGRHPELAERVVPDKGWRAPTALEREAMAVADFEPYRGTARFIELEGDIALLVGGGGGSLVFFDAVQRAGGRPACYTEIGGNPSSEKVRRLARVVLSCPGARGLLVGHNITNNTQVDLVATGVTQALADLGIDTSRFPVVAREVGTHDEVGRAIFAAAGVEHLGEDVTMEEAARLIVARVAPSST